MTEACCDGNSGPLRPRMPSPLPVWHWNEGQMKILSWTSEQYTWEVSLSLYFPPSQTHTHTEGWNRGQGVNQRMTPEIWSILVLYEWAATLELSPFFTHHRVQHGTLTRITHWTLGGAPMLVFTCIFWDINLFFLNFCKLTLYHVWYS